MLLHPIEQCSTEVWIGLCRFQAEQDALQSSMLASFLPMPEVHACHAHLIRVPSGIPEVGPENCNAGAGFAAAAAYQPSPPPTQMHMSSPVLQPCAAGSKYDQPTRRAPQPISSQAAALSKQPEGASHAVPVPEPSFLQAQRSIPTDPSYLSTHADEVRPAVHQNAGLRETRGDQQGRGYLSQNEQIQGRGFGQDIGTDSAQTAAAAGSFPTVRAGPITSSPDSLPIPGQQSTAMSRASAPSPGRITDPGAAPATPLIEMEPAVLPARPYHRNDSWSDTSLGGGFMQPRSGQPVPSDRNAYAPLGNVTNVKPHQSPEGRTAAPLKVPIIPEDAAVPRDGSVITAHDVEPDQIGTAQSKDLAMGRLPTGHAALDPPGSLSHGRGSRKGHLQGGTVSASGASFTSAASFASASSEIEEAWNDGEAEVSSHAVTSSASRMEHQGTTQQHEASWDQQKAEATSHAVTAPSSGIHQEAVQQAGVFLPTPAMFPGPSQIAPASTVGTALRSAGLSRETGPQHVMTEQESGHHGNVSESMLSQPGESLLSAGGHPASSAAVRQMEGGFGAAPHLSILEPAEMHTGYVKSRDTADGPYQSARGGLDGEPVEMVSRFSLLESAKPVITRSLLHCGWDLHL